MLNRTAAAPDSRSLLTGFLEPLVRTGSLTIVDARGRRRTFGNDRSGASVTVRLHDPALPLRLALYPSLALGEAYMEGTLTVEAGTLRDFLRIATSNFKALDKLPAQALRVRMARFFRSVRWSDNPRRARVNVAHHYDLSDALYELFLDGDRQYSCGYFATGKESLEEAQSAKKRHIAAKLLLEPGMRLLDIGCGWGGLAIELARDHGADVTGVTLSREQIRTARRRASLAGLDNRARFELRDYREIEGKFDRVVSVGMFEHVGPGRYTDFFDTLSRALKPDGVALVHSIGRMEPPGGADPWIAKYIFPGGYIPALSETLAAIEKVGLWVTDIEILRLHYADTLRHWYDRFQARREEAASIYDERFCRMWEFYLAACEMMFRNGTLMVFQIQLAHHPAAVPLTRDYITDFERRMEAG